MSSPLQARVETALANLSAQREKIRALQQQMTEAATTVTSKDRMIEATVDAQGRLTAVKLRGNRYRTLAPAEFASRLVETVQAAQVAAGREAAERLKAFMPSGLRLADALDGGFDMDKMFDAAINLADDPALRPEMLNIFSDGGDG